MGNQMGRIPLGLWLCIPILGSGCTSLQSYAAQPAATPQQLLADPGLNGRSIVPQYPSAPTNHGRSGVTKPANITPAQPQKQKLLKHDEIDLGPPQPFPRRSQRPVAAEKPGQRQVVGNSISTQSWKIPLQSTAERPVEISQAGLGSFRILVVGSIYGNEPESIELMDAIMREAQAFAQSPSYSFLFLRTPNPDGVVEHIRTNHNGVDLNRNFPSTWFTAIPNRLTGPQPASEVETQNLMRLLKEFQPHRVLHLRSSIGQRPLVLLNEKLEHASGQVHLHRRVDVGTYSGKYKVGSFEEYVTIRSDAELMTILLPPKGFLQLSSQELFQLATANFPVSKNQKTEQRSQPSGRGTPLAGSERVLPEDQRLPAESRSMSPDGEKGYVEFLPPPPSGEHFNRASRTTVPDESKFYELPPPPNS